MNKPQYALIGQAVSYHIRVVSATRLPKLRIMSCSIVAYPRRQYGLGLYKKYKLMNPYGSEKDDALLSGYSRYSDIQEF